MFKIIKVDILEKEAKFIRANVIYFRGSVSNVIPARIVGNVLTLDRAFDIEHRKMIKAAILDAAN